MPKAPAKLTPPALHEGVANVARGTLAARLMVLSHADGVQATRVGAAHVHAGAFPTVFVVGAVLVNAALRFDRAWAGRRGLVLRKYREGFRILRFETAIKNVAS